MKAINTPIILNDVLLNKIHSLTNTGTDDVIHVFQYEVCSCVEVEYLPETCRKILLILRDPS